MELYGYGRVSLSDSERQLVERLGDVSLDAIVSIDEIEACVSQLAKHHNPARIDHVLALQSATNMLREAQIMATGYRI